MILKKLEKVPIFLFFGTNINAVLRDERSVNLGAVYETVVAQELHAHGFPLHYYLPIYYCMFYQSDKIEGGEDLIIPKIPLPGLT